jgi:hypothetical protein
MHVVRGGREKVAKGGSLGRATGVPGELDLVLAVLDGHARELVLRLVAVLQVQLGLAALGVGCDEKDVVAEVPLARSLALVGGHYLGGDRDGDGRAVEGLLDALRLALHHGCHARGRMHMRTQTRKKRRKRGRECRADERGETGKRARISEAKPYEAGEIPQNGALADQYACSTAFLTLYLDSHSL